MSDVGGLTSQLTSSSFGRDVKLGVLCLDAAYTVGLNQLSVARTPDKATQNNMKQTNKQINSLLSSKEKLVELTSKEKDRLEDTSNLSFLLAVLLMFLYLMTGYALNKYTERNKKIF